MMFLRLKPRLFLRPALALFLLGPGSAHAALPLVGEVTREVKRQPQAEAEIEPELPPSSEEISPAPVSNAGLDIAALARLFEAQDAAWKKAGAGSLERAKAADVAGQSAADLAWKYFEAGDARAAAAWLSKRAGARKAAYQARRDFLNAKIARADRGLAQRRAAIESAWAELERGFPTLHARLLGDLKKVNLSTRPLEFSSSVAVQNSINALQLEEREAWHKATEAKDTARAAAHFERLGVLSRLWTALSQASSFRSGRWTLAAQREVVARAAREDADGLLFAEQDLQAHRAELERAREVGESAAFIHSKIAEIADTVDDRARAQEALGQIEAALQGQQEAIALRRSLPPAHEEASLQLPYRVLGRLYARQGQTRRAREYFLLALADIERGRPEHQARLARLPEAERFLKDFPARASEAVALLNLAVVTRDGGDSGEALALLERARGVVEGMVATSEAARSLDPARRSLLATIRGNRAVVLLGEAPSVAAAAELEAVARELRGLGEDEKAATALLNAGGAFREAKDLGKARLYTEQARRLFAQARDLRGLALAGTQLAALARAEGRLDQAEALVEQATRAAASSGDLATIAIARRHFARLRLAQKLPAEALQVLGEARQLDEQVGDPVATAFTFEIEADALRAQIPAGAPQANASREAAIAKYKAAIALIEGVRAKVSAQNSEGFGEREDTFRPYQSLVTLLIQAGRGDEAFDYLSRARSKKLRDSLRLEAIQTRDPALQVLLERAGAAEQKLRAAQDALQTEQSRPEGERDAGRIGQLKLVVASTQGEFLRLSRELSEKNPSYDRIISIKPTQLKTAQPDIPADVALVQYAPLGEQLYIFVVTRESLKILAPPVRPAELRTRIREFRKLMDQAREKFARGESIGVEDWKSQADWLPMRDSLDSLYSMLLAPIEGEIKSKSTVAFVPTQLLCYLPLHALAKKTDSGVRFFIEDKRVAYLAAADVLKIVKPRDDKSRGRGMVALGNPKGADLPFAGEEARSVAQVFRASQQEAQELREEKATKPALLASENLSRRVWHLATHGHLNQADPLRSYIQLAPSGEASTARLTLAEVWGLDLSHVDLVTLSACQTALGERDPDGSEVTSLADSFSGAGAQSVLASLWSVADDSTSALMTSFYRELSAGKSKADALREAELSLLKNPETNHPFFWAPFVLMGDWR